MRPARYPKKKFGQHFLADSGIAEKIVESAGIASEETVLEIGPGEGVLTEILIGRAREVFAVEIDRDLVPVLKKKFAGEKNLHLVEGNILRINLDSLFSGVKGKSAVVSNLPYNISTPVIDLLVENRKLFSRAVLMLQKEVAERLLASPGSKNYGLTTLNLALFATGEKLMDVPPEAFSPPPEVMSSVIKLFFNDEPLYHLEYPSIFHKITGVSFRQRRKMLRNTLVPYIVSLGLGESEALELIGRAEISNTARPEEIPVRSWVLLSNEIGRRVRAGS